MTAPTENSKKWTTSDFPHPQDMLHARLNKILLSSMKLQATFI